MATHKTKPQCHIHDTVEDWNVDDFRKSVCVNDSPLTKHNDGNHYCLFHLPTRDKDVGKFEAKFGARLKAVEDKIAAIEELPEDEREKARDGISYDFRYVWFPSEVDLNKYKFMAAASFGSATFTAAAYFHSATFSADAHFSETTFSAPAYFSSATFSADADFDSATFAARAEFLEAAFSSYAHFESATFSADASFSLATFSAYASFNWATFLAEVDFWDATFSADAYFGDVTFSGFVCFIRAKFGKTGHTSFSEANFAKDTFFDRTRFRNNVSFNSATLAMNPMFSFAMLSLPGTRIFNIADPKDIYALAICGKARTVSLIFRKRRLKRWVAYRFIRFVCDRLGL